ncbi:3-isopropylmalate dehydratase small subunit [Caballeronia sp. BR00000012568055]|uniref:3-isopropylmalate dehydratase small subunit n=1 Tax=Caballeronia sp. BR00000012568055 TaxID=2918761 RepID=UPI0023F6C26B|nr:3-isopropylmalate dehydratase small subunit [Caballeronia sp. BR00000012568055]
MSDFSRVEGVAATLPIANLDTDQIMPKQFLLGTDKSGLARGVLFDLRVAPDGHVRETFVLNRPEWRNTKVIVGGANFGCGSSREHAVWGLQQFGIEAVIAPSYGEIFYYNAANNRLLTVMLTADEVAAISAEVEHAATSRICIDVAAQVVRTASGQSYAFQMDERQRNMYLDGLDVLGASLKRLPEIEAFERQHWRAHPWTRVLPLARVA